MGDGLLPFNIGCGFCRNREQGFTNYCLTTNPEPVGLMCAYSAILKSARMVMIVDRHPDRLRLAEKIGAIPIDDSRVSPSDRIMELTNGRRADKDCESVGYQAHDPQGHEHPNIT